MICTIHVYPCCTELSSATLKTPLHLLCLQVPLLHQLYIHYRTQYGTYGTLARLSIYIHVSLLYLNSYPLISKHSLISSVCRFLDFISYTGLSMVETDGPYGGYQCSSTNHSHHTGLADSVYYQQQLQVW